jgi:hypothetical protein
MFAPGAKIGSYGSACVKELGTTNRKENVLERVFSTGEGYYKWKSQAY